MFAILPFLTLVAIFLIIRKKYPQFDSRLVFLLAAAFWGVLLVFITELSSLFHVFNYPVLSITWALLTIVLGVWAFVPWKRIVLAPIRLELLQWLQIACIAAVAALTLAIAIIAAPNNWDSMVYHLSRVAHWVQNGSVAHYPTPVTRQLIFPVFAEYQIAHLQILSGGDHLAQLPQWLSMLSCAAIVSLICKRLGGGTSAQIFSVFFTTTLPMGILQSTTSQNDYVVAFWLAGLSALILENDRHTDRIIPVGIGLCLGLAVLTKTSAYFFGLPVMLYYGVRGLLRQKARFIPIAAVVLVIALALNLPHYARNFSLYGNPLGPREETSRHQNAQISLQGVSSNAIRSLGMYAGTVDPLNSVLNTAVGGLHAAMGMDTDDPHFTLEGYEFLIERPSFHEDTMGSSWHLALALIAWVILLFQRKKLPNLMFIPLGLCVLAGFLIFCAMVRWMPWNVRLHLPLLVLSASWTGLLTQVSKKWVQWAVTIVFAALTLPVFYFNPNKPLIADYTIFNLPRREVMIMRKNLVVPYIESVNYLTEQDCYQTGLYLPDQEWEYPFWSLYADTGKDFRLEHVNVQNETASIKTSPFSPCAVIATQSAGETFTLDGEVYTLTWSMEPVYVYTR
jgi:4-amino-4-deoxy-L-arabinose transferase-like glycosyltransferase